MVHVNINGRDYDIDCEPTARLIDVLRKDLGFTGVKEGCGEGECGACSVIIDGKLSNSCLVAAGSIDGSTILTIDGFKDTEKFKVIDDAFADCGSVQCGFCIPGMIMAAECLLESNPHPTEDDVRLALSGNICRCTGYNMIISGILLAAERGNGLW